MLTRALDGAVSGREDLSRYLVHLTRDTVGEFGMQTDARTNFDSILTSRVILARKPHCMFNRKLASLPQEGHDLLKVVCFTEVPLSYLHKLTGAIAGRSTHLSSYGFVFKRRHLMSQGAQPVVYVNNYAGVDDYRRAFDALFDATAAAHDYSLPAWRILPYVNAMHEKYDFHWEREWRHVGDFSFNHSDLVCLVVPEDDKAKMEIAMEIGAPVIAPGWSYDAVLHRMSTQIDYLRRANRKLQVKLDKSGKDGTENQELNPNQAE